MPSPLAISKFRGLDTRPGQYGIDSENLLEATNLQVRSGGFIETRPGLQHVLPLHAQSKGLYARGGKLHAVVPGGQGLQDFQPYNVTYDPIGKGGVAYPLSIIDRVTAADTFGLSSGWGAWGYIAIKRLDTGLIEHHWVKDPPATAATPVSTFVTLPFTPGPALTKMVLKMFATNPQQGLVNFSSTLNGPSDWVRPGDAGFENIAAHVSGDRDPVALLYYRNRLAVFFMDAIQIWNVNTDPQFNSLQEVLNGPGAILPGAVCNLLGDAIYLGRGGFRTLSKTQGGSAQVSSGVSAVTGESKEDDVGSRIRTLTDLIAPGASAVSLWSQDRSQFLCAIGTTVYCFTYIPSQDLGEWTVWTLPVALDYLVDLDGVIYARSGDDLYVFNDQSSIDILADNSSAPVSWAFKFRDFALEAPNRTKTTDWLTIRQTAPARWQLLVDDLGLSNRLVPACSPKALRFDCSGEGKSISLRATGTGTWRLDGLALDYRIQNQ